MSDANFAKIIHEEDRTLKKARDIAIGVGVRGCLVIITMGIVGFDTVAQKLDGPRECSCRERNECRSECYEYNNRTGRASRIARRRSPGLARRHTRGWGSNRPLQCRGQPSHDPPAVRVRAPRHRGAAEFLSGETNLQFNSDSGLEQLQHVWHAADGDPRTKLAFLGQAVIVGGLGELAQPLQQVAEAGVEKTRKWRWGRSANCWISSKEYSVSGVCRAEFAACFHDKCYESYVTTDLRLRKWVCTWSGWAEKLVRW
ncbi:hypothetical protein EYC84_004168 [Monilinia fructicola]|uniref:Uncharacterized protein n=1 Tax=Monilinia fructicola TaxID=38448 RepID=A0A5M9K4I3_MONFR|nr:hypothetical protein EYC84_004168 [Monilinia fructicola]